MRMMIHQEGSKAACQSSNSLSIFNRRLLMNTAKVNFLTFDLGLGNAPPCFSVSSARPIVERASESFLFEPMQNLVVMYTQLFVDGTMKPSTVITHERTALAPGSIQTPYFQMLRKNSIWV
jgi:hypothetical protein